MVKKRKLESALGAVAFHQWDPSLKQGDLVYLLADRDTPHVYIVHQLYQRIIMDHELFNNPSLLARGIKPGDEIVPLLVLRRVREAPHYTELTTRRTIERQVDASKVIKITETTIQLVVANLTAMSTQILSPTTEETET